MNDFNDKSPIQTPPPLDAQTMFKDRLAFYLAMTGLLGLYVFGYFTHFDVSDAAVMLVATFLGGHAAQKIMVVRAAAADPACDTLKTIKELDK